MRLGWKKPPPKSPPSTGRPRGIVALWSPARHVLVEDLLGDPWGSNSRWERSDETQRPIDPSVGEISCLCWPTGELGEEMDDTLLLTR